MESFLKIEAESDFSLENIPFGVFSLKTENQNQRRCATRIGNYVIDLSYLEKMKLLNIHSEKMVFDQPTLNSFMELGKPVWISVRNDVRKLFTKGSEVECITKNLSLFAFDVSFCDLHLPVHIGDYTDFYSSRDHAYNVGVMFRGPENALQPNWLWLPVGYHGRSSSIVVSPSVFSRPSGQIKGPNDAKPKHEKSKKMDFELEIGMIVGKKNILGEPIDIKNAEEHIFGFVLLNDVSARDIQNWEYVPLGPFTAKNCITVISPWIVQAEALKPVYQKLPVQDPEPLDYLNDPKYGSYNVNLDVTLKTPTSEKEHLITQSNMKYLYWSFGQQLSHHTVTGCNMNVGDLLGSGTISGKDKKESGSFLELSNNGKEPMVFENGEKRAFWEDGDTIILKGHANVNGKRVGFGDCITKMTP